MSIVVVTGAAGFIGSHLAERLAAAGHEVRGIDAFIPYYPRALKEQNLTALAEKPNFSLYELDLRTDDLSEPLDGADTVIHLAAQAGLVRSWDEFDSYMTCNIQATQRLLEAAVNADVKHHIHASTSSIYGRFATGDETSPAAPVSPYGITKLAAENLCWAYAQKDALPVTVLRLFSVYGPRQRPDMGYNIFIRKILNDELITIDGDGSDSRSNTFVLDCVDGIMRAMEQPEVSMGETYNIGGGQEVNVLQVLDILADLTGKTPNTTHGPKRPGDQRRTVADIAKARVQLGYNPQTTVREGLAAQLAWQRQA
ncbi:MAG: NAD-dependent epimerase/dehydratase family protein [Caldilineaceae bacterium]|nr:NAD-dependent epimerase/dehydratase family protein [Caldilineaceae bacterium]